MAHVTLPEGLAGISGPLRQFPETARPLNDLAQALLRGPSSITPAEREMIAAYVSTRNECTFCAGSHTAAARILLGEENRGLMEKVNADPETAPISEKMKGLLAIAAKVQMGGRRVTDEDVQRARNAGADDKAIHDAVLVAAAFCMFNRYVDGLATLIPEDSHYDLVGEHLAKNGYEPRPAA